MRKLIRNFLLVLFAGLIACTPRTYGTMGDTTSLAGLKSMGSTKKASAHSTAKASTGKIRNTALRETALSLGAQSGLAARAKSIDDQLVRQTRHLDAIFDFKSLILANNVLPPVLLQGNNTLNIASAQAIRVADRTYKLAKQARFITTPPNWRQYLWLDYKKPEDPHISMLPDSKEERQVWCYFIERGWQNGVEQADTILTENIARIKEDFTGMILYRKLLAMNMVSAPYVSHTDLGVTGDGNALYIDDRVLRITALPALNINSSEWRAAVAKDSENLKEFNKMEQRINAATVAVSHNAWQPVISPVN
ncbi:MAG: type IV secretion system DotC family protein [Gammaproteobacteria bacterium]|nr:type IV secretion system DotC family protein [Gammaproteobacteria bacterium]MCH9716103.1 type IV secretion system DotC family protein [Gammaproteobacteria bacterium]MCH9763287.1 type IV secretion system DotC family protein [Gammaproteobacteria bacterium]